jgi:hypothetical protein
MDTGNSSKKSEKQYSYLSYWLEGRLSKAVIIMTRLKAKRAVMGYPLRPPARPVEATEKVSISNIYIPYIVRNNIDDTICCMTKLILITFSVPSLCPCWAHL